MAATAKAFFLSRLADFPLKPIRPQQLQLPFSRHLLLPSAASAVSAALKTRSSAVLSCLVSGVDGGGVSDTRKSGIDREFSVIANMLKRIEPLDTSVISKGVSDSAKASMKQTISTMLGLLPSDQFSVTVRVSKRPLDRLLSSSIITGYTLWNAEYRISLMRNLDISPDSLDRSNCSKQGSAEMGCMEDGGNDECLGGCGEDLEGLKNQIYGDLSPGALSYIQQLESELSNVKEDLNCQNQGNIHIERERKNINDLLEYLRSLEPEMVTELSRPSSLEVDEIIHQLVQNILQRFFKDDTTTDFMGDSAIGSTENYQDGGDGLCDTISTSRDYLARLLFWCMLMGHHLRGLENRLHLTCVVGLL